MPTTKTGTKAKQAKTPATKTRPAAKAKVKTSPKKPVEGPVTKTLTRAGAAAGTMLAKAVHGVSEAASAVSSVVENKAGKKKTRRSVKPKAKINRSKVSSAVKSKS